MLELVPARPEGRPLRLLFVGAHSDDIEIGCAGTVVELGMRHHIPTPVNETLLRMVKTLEQSYSLR